MYFLISENTFLDYSLIRSIANFYLNIALPPKLTFVGEIG